MKILLCADLHLGSKMLTSLSPAKSGERRRELLLTFKNLIDGAREHGAECLLIAGDLFDTDKVSAKTVQYVASCAKEARDLQFYCIAGNHDTLSVASLRECAPDNLHFFSDEWTTHTYKGLAITARDTLSDDMYEKLSLPEGYYNVVMLHGQEKPSGSHTDDLVVISLLENKGIDCLALGHLHTYHSYPLGKRGVVCYPGCPEGRGFDECSDKGYVIIDTEKEPINGLTFVKSCLRSLHDIHVEIDQNDVTLMDFERKVLAAIEGIPSCDMVKITLDGSFFAEAQKDIPYLERLLEERLYSSRIKDCTTLYIDMNDYIGDISLKGEFIRAVAELEGDPDFLRDVAECGIKALRGDEIE